MSKAVVALVLMVAGAAAAAPAVLPGGAAPQVQVQVLAASEPGAPTGEYGTCYYTRSCGGGGGKQ